MIGTERTLIKTIRGRQMQFLGHIIHIIRKEGLEELFLAGCIEGKRSRGRQRLKYIASLRKWMDRYTCHRDSRNVQMIQMF